MQSDITTGLKADRQRGPVRAFRISAARGGFKGKPEIFRILFMRRGKDQPAVGAAGRKIRRA